MYLELTEEQKLIQDTARDFAKAELEPVAAQLDQGSDRGPLLANLKKLAELGFMGLNVREEYGGAEAGAISFSVAMTEIARACASTAVTVSVNNMAAEVIQVVGSEEQKRAYIPKICSGEYSAASFALTETCAGSDPAGMVTQAVDDGDSWVLNGSKIFITSASYAGVFVVWAVTDKAAPKGKGISCFLVEAGTPGLIIGKEEHKMGQHASATNEVIFTDCRIPKSAMMGKLNDGFRIAVAELAGGRIGIGSLGLGVGLAAMDHATRYASERTQFGQKISNFQAIQWMVADAYTELEAARLLLMNAAFRKDQGKSFAKEASMAKLYATEAANRACYAAIQMLGGYGYTQDFPVERYARDARITSIYEGTSEIQRVVISREILKNFNQ
ncbi:acyl-CoA dehydrogenase domain protein [Geobacter metallireducens RCH3]|uniref:Cyclohex-1-ene-1-carbonyl-CoA dehydrogenase n=1 Tax=Geobacter metallireducens (strain ATCC 53774 / DSM 7210 / GS-15) TaxID=269799 RepID=Q39UY3_GEOMG|nr:acyl-CoA dehydrogenase family protein [Geobacter metallireducens]ABB31941.1 short-chain acyl-CoA dehydrogenase [Geobacter metallireducens GS-15]EHP84957.1 acyl-CoA dehydrogenase domain protein [Geobacter metallireducens RCH3]